MDENKGQKSNRRQAPVSGVEGEKRHAQASQGRAPRTASANRGENDIDRGMAPPKARGHQNRASRSDSARRSETVEKPRRARRSPNNAIAQAPQTAEKQHRSPHRHDERPCTEKSAHGHREHQDAEQKRSRATRNPRELVVETLMRIEDGGYSNIVWDLAIRHADLSNLDKMLATRIFYGTLSNMRLIDALWNDIEPEMLRRADPVVKMTLRSAMYQLVFLDRVPAYSIVSTSVEVVKRLRNRAACGYCNALLRKAVARKDAGNLVYTPTGDALTDFAVKYSVNDELASLLIEEFGDDASNIAESMLAVPKMVLRINRSRTSIDDFLSKVGVSVERSSRLPNRACSVMSRHSAIDAAIEAGDVCVQDEAAQIAVQALGAPEQWGGAAQEVHIWDACAGLGGKTLHILDEVACDTSGRRYSLLSTDLYANKLERLREAHQKFFKSEHLITKARDLTLGGSVPLAPFDVILVDAPCSGLGVLRRHPEVKLYRTREAIESLVELQKTILDNVCRHLRIGGILVYAVCTITAEECERQAQAFLERHPNYSFDALPAECAPTPDAHDIKLLPHADGCDGFYVARFRRNA